MFKRSLLLGITAGILSGVACMVFAGIYKEAMFVDFSPVISTMQYFGSCLFGCILASLGYVAVMKVTPKFGDVIFNMLFAILTFASLMGPLMYKFPPELDVEGIDEITMYFQPYTFTLHLVPALIWFTLKPIFIKK
jgi:hypothetical protein